MKEEKKLWKKGFRRVACLDEVGRGPLCGPVVACAVTINKGFNLSGSSNLNQVRDSKKLSAKKREELYRVLTCHQDIEWGIGRVSEKVIDRINIFQATKMAMEKAIKKLQSKIAKVRPSSIDYLILDGKIALKVDIPQKSIVKADEKVFSVACASIIAKVIRDRIMQRYDKKYPVYGLKKHKGYPTVFHKSMLKKYGISEIHRKSFHLT